MKLYSISVTGILLGWVQLRPDSLGVVRVQ